MTDASVRPAVWMITSAFLFAAMGAFTNALGPRCDWLTIALVRALVMFVAAVGMARLSGAALVFWKPRTLWLRSLAGSFSLVCSFYALTRLPVGDVLTLTNTYPLWILVLSWLALRQSPRWIELLGVVSGLAGVVLIERPHLGGDDAAALVALASSVSTAIAMIGLHRLRGVDTWAVIAHFAGVASIVAAVWLTTRAWQSTDSAQRSLPPALEAATLSRSAAIAPLRPPAEPVVLALLMGVGLTGTVGQIFLTKAYAAGAPARVAVLGLTQVVFGMGFDALLWRRALPWTSLAGTLLILAPTALLLRRATQAVAANRRSQPAPVEPARAT